MNEIWVGVFAIIVGLLFCFRGFIALRSVIGIWGAFVGFAVGMAVMRWAQGNFFGDVLSWIVAFGLTLVFKALAYAVAGASGWSR